jgi:CubicO group peptidase (beta-lactamase class C family)
LPGIATIVVQNEKVLYKNSFGLANVELKVDLQPEMCFKIGSISKQFTAAAIFILEERGLLSLEDKMLDFLPGYSVEFNEIKIIHLLSHTSGVRDYTVNNSGSNTTQDRISPKELVELMLSHPLDFGPGEEWEYSNSNYTILARIIENVTGEVFHKFMNETIFQPIGMKHTCYTDSDTVIPGLVNGYRMDGSVLKTAEYINMTHTFGAGDIVSCVEDMARWNRALLEGQIISKDNVARCFTPVVLNDGTVTTHGIGWFMDNYRGLTTYYHDGGVYGFQSLCTYIPGKDLYMVMFRNRSDICINYPTNVVCNMIADYILGNISEDSAHTPILLSEEQLKKYTGIYQFVESTGKRKISLKEGRLYYEIPPRRGNIGSKNEIIPESVFSFFAEGKKSTITFEFNAKYEVTGMNVNQAFGRVAKLKKIE